ncbi:hypothetical protein DFQ04_2827 [Algoriphagus boseongensis]|uniref:Uncharacterized protein n=1 Tax=Algoriphagus boseongensis TaxID=1442587 RepID=A0A4R6T5B2_9BACT|nr:hypothetical protein [Algoriphagus boseongensis]TDQ14946.1 hypothetical protein DFQ04_2827 [Algoriphagus boseongensis]
MISKRFYRLIALWVLAETFLGGLLHAFRIPLAGVFIACFSALFISLIYTVTGSSKKVLHATVIVLIFKMILSPHAPLGAFLSVALQGGFGAIALAAIPSTKTARMLVTVFAYLQSATLKLISLTILFGMGFWEALDEFMLSIVSYFPFFATILSAKNLVLAYLGIYLLSGVIAGWMIGRVTLNPVKINLDIEVKNGRIAKKKGSLLQSEWLLIAGLSAVYFVPIFPDSFREMCLRAAIILTAWHLIFGPLLKKALFRILGIRKSSLLREILLIESILPELRENLSRSWQIASTQNLMRRIPFFVKTWLQMSL